LVFQEGALDIGAVPGRIEIGAQSRGLRIDRERVAPVALAHDA
jgi:hypothetical protein